MQSIGWWPNLDSDTQAWLIAHNGEPVSSDVLTKIVAADGGVISNAWWVGEGGPDGFYLPDEAVDWIEAAGNGER